MLATLVIGLREGLEAALIVGIVAAFLKRNGHRLTAMWVGVGAALVVSLAVGVALWLLEASLPQAAQEGMETVIGAVAVVFVTGMVVWMSGHARTMKRELEAEAAEALGAGTARALAVMAFLAVLKEGFETSVFLLATFRAAVTPGAAAAGALIGIAGAVAIGWGIYAGGVRLNLGRFFRFTGVFLLLVAAGLVLTALRTAHEAGWLEGGQQRTLDLAWLAPPGSVQASLVTGVLGIPADPRVIEVVAWLAYLVPTAIVLFLPERLKPTGTAARRLRLGLGAGLIGAGAVVAVCASIALAPAGASTVRTTEARGAALSGAVAAVGTDRFRFGADVVRLPEAAATTHEGLQAEARTGTARSSAPGASTMTLDALVAANGGRLPVGVDASRARGPFAVRGTDLTAVTVWTVDGRVIDARTSTSRVLTVSGGGLASPRTITAGSPVSTRATTSSAAAATRAARADQTAVVERPLWAVQVPLLLVVAGALLLASTATRRLRAARTAPRTTGSTTYAVK